MAGIGTKKAFKLINITQTRDVKGNPSNTNSTELRGWGEVTDIRSNRSYDGQSHIDKFFEVKFRFRDDISVNVDSRIILDRNRYVVQGIRKDKMKNFYWILTVQAKAFS
jgi:head-tail adaptor